MGTIKLHDRKEIEFDQDEHQAKYVAKQLFWSKTSFDNIASNREHHKDRYLADFCPSKLEAHSRRHGVVQAV